MNGKVSKLLRQCALSITHDRRLVVDKQTYKKLKKEYRQGKSFGLGATRRQLEMLAQLRLQAIDTKITEIEVQNESTGSSEA